MPDRRHPFIFLGRNTMGIYFFHYPILILMNGLLILKIPQLMNVWALFGISVLFVLVLGSHPVNWMYNGVLSLLTFLIFKREKKVKDEGLEDEYDNDDEDKFVVIAQRRIAIEKLASTLETDENEKDQEEGQS